MLPIKESAQQNVARISADGMLKVNSIIHVFSFHY